MKKWLYSAFCASILFAGCGDNTQSAGENMAAAIENAAGEMMETPVESEATVAEAAVQPSEHTELLGFYVGMFFAEDYKEDKKPMYANKINISVDHILGDQIKGHSVVAGNQRPFSGNIHDEDGIWMVDVNEPGDDKYDGKFSFAIHPDGSMKGLWYANNKSLAVTKRSYTLHKKEFKYSPDNSFGEDFEFATLYDTYNTDTDQEEVVTENVTKYNASKTALNKSDLENLYKGDLEIIRNAVYARHGYSFKNRKMRYFFDNYAEWYIPVSTDVRESLTDLEIKNIDLIKRYEQHADRYYDSFGR